ncbi:cytochrome c oxidase assembly protein COX16 homolog, mitochondrial [Halyomorpha halys]|uniref:cytochrome c oxidase assembly protein COX16 homolog, mitochondrial n=1 Tax=Halyomorpha halys TaxID=286706 RepID=UPI0006D4DA6C|nr:cytochrome c oxidase assembly protein COX16 homolog, mitochondrial [Halyomorpha halys]
MIHVLEIFRKPLVKYGMPFFTLIVGGSLGLKEFSQLRFQYSKTSLIRPEEAEAYGVKMKKPGEVTLETEFEKIKSLDTENWEMVRGPRPWEENSTKK